MSTATVEKPARPSRMSVSSMCRDSKHRSCKELRMKCTCDCHQAAVAAVAHANGTAKKAARTPVRQPVIELVKADPPTPVKIRKPTLSEQIRPLLEQILVDEDHDWYRVALFFKARQASMNLKRVREAHSKAEWEWRAARLDEVEQSAIYVRWIGKERSVL